MVQGRIFPDVKFPSQYTFVYHIFRGGMLQTNMLILIQI